MRLDAYKYTISDGLPMAVAASIGTSGCCYSHAVESRDV